MFIVKYIAAFGKYLDLMGRTFSIPERMRMFMKQYVKEMEQLGVDSIGIVLLISFVIGAVICIQIKLNIQSPWMPAFTTGYTTREIMVLEFSSSIMCLILAGKVGSNIASAVAGIITPDDLTVGLLHSFNSWFIWMSIIKSVCFAFIIASVSSYYGYNVQGGSFDVGKASTNAVVSSSMLILFADIFLTQLLS